MSTFGTRIEQRAVKDWLSGQNNVDLWPPYFDNASVTVQASSTINTKGSWIELVASSSISAGWLMYNWTNSTGATATAGLVDIGVGPAGSEQIIIENLPSGYGNNQTRMMIPVQIPAGSRIAARAQSVISSRNATVTIGLLKPSLSFYVSGIDTINSDAANSSANVKVSSASGEIVASTSANYKALVFGYAASVDTAMSALGGSVVRLRTGASGSEVDVARISLGKNIAEFMSYAPVGLETAGLYVGHVPAGTRLSYAVANTFANDGLIVYGIKG
jgi:hypothetical protein